MDEGDVDAELAQAGVIRLGDLLSTASRAIAQRFGVFAVITIVLMVPAIAAEIGYQEWAWAQVERLRADPSVLLETQARSEFVLAQQFMGLATALIQFVLFALAQAALMFATVEFMGGRRASIGASLKAGLSRAHVVVAVALLAGIATGLGLLACVIPGIMLYCVLYASVPSAVVERLGPIEAMQRSAELTSGHRLTIFLAAFVILLVASALHIVVAMSFDVTADVAVASSVTSRFAQYALTSVVQIGTTMFQAAVVAVFYARVRGIKDGVDADAIADVFK